MQLQRMWDLIRWEAYEQFTTGHAAKGLESHTERERGEKELGKRKWERKVMVVHSIVQKASHFNQFHCKEHNSIKIVCVGVRVVVVRIDAETFPHLKKPSPSSQVLPFRTDTIMTTNTWGFSTCRHTLIRIRTYADVCDTFPVSLLAQCCFNTLYFGVCVICSL